MLLDILEALAATFPFSVIQQIISLLGKMEVCFLCPLPGCLLSKPALTSQQEMWVPLSSAGLFWPSSAFCSFWQDPVAARLQDSSLSASILQLSCETAIWFTSVLFFL